MLHQDLGRVAALVAVVLVIGAGFCMFDTHQHAGGHEVVSDLCLGMVGVATVLMPLAGALALAGWAPGLLIASAPSVSLFVADPPPKLASLR
jgi:hypothetical protein